jgi:uncharacterized protein YbjT (DUF2867 family)
VVDVGDDLLEQLSDVVVVQLVDHPAPVALADHQPEMAKQPQLMRHRRPEATGHEFAMPRHEELDLFDPPAVADAVRDVDGVLHLATRIRSLDQLSDLDAWRENDRLRTDASRILVDAANHGRGDGLRPAHRHVCLPA